MVVLQPYLFPIGIKIKSTLFKVLFVLLKGSGKFFNILTYTKDLLNNKYYGLKSFFEKVKSSHK
jgi:hypothetical protein